MGFTTEQRGLYARVLLPLPLPEIYTYGVPVEFHEDIVVGLRVEVPFNKKLYSGIVTNLSNVCLLYTSPSPRDRG